MGGWVTINPNIVRIFKSVGINGLRICLATYFVFGKRCQERDSFRFAYLTLKGHPVYCIGSNRAPGVLSRGIGGGYINSGNAKNL